MAEVIFEETDKRIEMEENIWSDKYRSQDLSYGHVNPQLCLKYFALLINLWWEIIWIDWTTNPQRLNF